MKMDNLLNFIWRIAYSYLKLGTLTLDDLDAFGYYFWKIQQNKDLSAYCEVEGYVEIVKAAESLKPIWDREESALLRRSKPTTSRPRL